MAHLQKSCKFTAKIRENSNKKANNKSAVIENTGHAYREHYLDLAQTIIDFVRS